MSEQRWTPGPWCCDQRQIIAPRGEESRGGLVATCRGSAHTRSIANANARLIAAAPELYAALQLVMDDPESLDGRPRTAEKVAEAMAKARGEK